MYVVGARKHGSHKWSVILRTWSRSYALRVALKWRRRGFDTMIEDIQQENEGP
jgi:hypothetical protein